MESFMDLIQKRESCRDYSDRNVEREKIGACIEAARLAPSACNAQPWQFVAVTGEESAAKIAKCLQGGGMNKFTDKAPVFVVVAEEKANLASKLGGAVKDQDFTSLDIGLAAMQFCLEATEQGLGTCMIGWFSEPGIRAVLGIPKSKRIRLVIAVGYPATDKIREKQRKAVDEMSSFIE